MGKKANCTQTKKKGEGKSDHSLNVEEIDGSSTKNILIEK